MDEVNNFTCLCLPGYTGRYCDVNIDDCVDVVCQNGGSCMDEVNNFTCLCLPGYEGRHCQVQPNPCFPSPCLFGGQCSLNVSGFYCTCPIGRGGRLCEEAINVTTPMFSGVSYISHATIESNTFELNITMRIRPLANDGVILYNGVSGPGSGDYVAIVLSNGFVHFSYDLGSGAIQLQSTRPLQLEAWHTISAVRVASTGSLQVNNDVIVSGRSPGSSQALNVDGSLWIGGIDNFTTISPQVGVSRGYHGCIDYIRLDSVRLSLIESAVSGMGVGQCEQDLCDPSPCQNEGSCQVVNGAVMCLCVQGYTGPGYTGRYCDVNIDDCVDVICQNGGSIVCQNGGSCMDEVNNFTCLCLPLFMFTRIHRTRIHRTLL
jgi:hypothetical protein